MAKPQRKQTKATTKPQRKKETKPQPDSKLTKAQARAKARQDARNQALQSIRACKNRESVESAIKVLSGKPGYLTDALLPARQALYFDILPELAKSTKLKTRDNMLGLLTVWNFVQERDLKDYDLSTHEAYPVNTEINERGNKIYLDLAGLASRDQKGMTIKDTISTLQGWLSDILNKGYFYGYDDTPKP